jgi:hypothetical protein
VFIRYRELRLSVKMCAGSCGNSWLRINSVWWMADISTRSMFCKPISLCAIFILSSGFHIPYPAFPGSHISTMILLGGVNDPSVK